MTRARRISSGEATHSQRVLDEYEESEPIFEGDEHVGHTVPKVGEATDEPREEGQSLPAEAKRFCKRCESGVENVAIMVSRAGRPIQVAADQPVVIAHTGTVHLNAGEGLTVCGLEIPAITA